MPIVDPFEEHTDRYESWFETYEEAYESELAALERVLPEDASPGVEIGVGSGRFAAPLDIEAGVDPSPEMLERARERDVAPIHGVAEFLPIRTDSLALAVLVTTICFVDDIEATVREAYRVLQPGGSLLIGFVARESPLGRTYREKQESNPFYQDATFVAVPDLLDALDAAGFDEPSVVQTLFTEPSALDGPDRVESGWGEGSFVVIAAQVPA